VLELYLAKLRGILLLIILLAEPEAMRAAAVLAMIMGEWKIKGQPEQLPDIRHEAHMNPQVTVHPQPQPVQSSPLSLLFGRAE
jgi:hypothetical protein